MRQLNDFSKICVMILDVDGVLTDGRIGYGGAAGPGDEIKFFHVRDGHALRMANRAGFKVGILSGRKTRANQLRAAELGFDFIYENVHRKLDGFEQLLADLAVTPEQCMYIGDDLIDMPPMKRCALAVAVGDAAPELDSVAHLRTRANGGNGAVREAVEFILKGQGKWDLAIERYLQ